MGVAALLFQGRPDHVARTGRAADREFGWCPAADWRDQREAVDCLWASGNQPLDRKCDAKFEEAARTAAGIETPRVSPIAKLFVGDLQRQRALRRR